METSAFPGLCPLSLELTYITGMLQMSCALERQTHASWRQGQGRERGVGQWSFQPHRKAEDILGKTVQYSVPED